MRPFILNILGHCTDVFLRWSQRLPNSADGQALGNMPVAGQGRPSRGAGLITGGRSNSLNATWLPLCQGSQQSHEIRADGV